MASDVELVPALEATTERTFNVPSTAILPTTVPAEFLNSANGALAPDAAFITKDSSYTVISGAVSILKRAILLLFCL